MFAARCEEYSTQVNDDIEDEDDEELKFLVFICFYTKSTNMQTSIFWKFCQIELDFFYFFLQ